MNMRVLIADDSKPMRELVARSLHKATTSSLDIEFASDGEEALATAMEWKPHLIFSDWNMPKLDGIAFGALPRAPSGHALRDGNIRAQRCRKKRSDG